MKLHAQMYIVGGLGIVLSMLSGTLQDGHLVISAPWDAVIKLSALLCIAAWFVEGFDIWKEQR